MSIEKYYKNVLTIGAPSVARPKYRILADGLNVDVKNCSMESTKWLFICGPVRVASPGGQFRPVWVASGHFG